MVQLTARRLDGGEVPAAYALVRSAVPGVTLGQWMAFAGRQQAQAGGLLGVSAAEGPLIGIAAYRPDLCLVHGRILKIDLFAAFELRRSAPVRAALLETLGAIARDSGCFAIELMLGVHGEPSPAPVRIETWQSMGYSAGPLVLTRSLPREADDRPRTARAA